MKPDGLILEPPGSKGLAPSKFKACILQRCIDLVHIKDIVIEIAALYLIIEPLLFIIAVLQLKKSYRSLKEIWYCFYLKALRSDTLRCLVILRDFKSKVSWGNAFEIPSLIFFSKHFNIFNASADEKLFSSPDSLSYTSAL